MFQEMHFLRTSLPTIIIPVGGYHPAKIAIYQELFENKLSGNSQY
jgi:hypothetical protein